MVHLAWWFTLLKFCTFLSRLSSCQTSKLAAFKLIGCKRVTGTQRSKRLITEVGGSTPVWHMSYMPVLPFIQKAMSGNDNERLGKLGVLNRCPLCRSRSRPPGLTKTLHSQYPSPRRDDSARMKSGVQWEEYSERLENRVLTFLS